MGSIGGQASGDFKLSQGALRILYSLIKDTLPSLAADGFTQSNPNVVTTASAVSTTLPTNVKKGVLGGSVAFLRPDIGGNTVGGAVLVSSAYVVNTRPVGLFLNDAAGNVFENTPAVASGKSPFLRGGAVGLKLYESDVQSALAASLTPSPVTGGFTTATAVGTSLTYAVGQFLYASVNGYLTNIWQDSYEAQWINTAATGSGSAGVATENDCTRMGVVLSPPDATSTEMFVELFL